MSARSSLLLAIVPLVLPFQIAVSVASAQTLQPSASLGSPSRARATTTPLADSLGIRDLLDVATPSVADLSSDGRWLALTIAVRRDALGADGSRDGDPTYLRAAPVQLLVVDTKTLERRAVFKSKTGVRSALWSPDASRLAILTVDSLGQRLQLWDRVSGRMTAARLTAGQYVAENSELKWSDDGRSVFFAARTDAWRTRARAQFDAITKAPVIVLDGSDSFLEWDAMMRMSAERSLLAMDATTGAVRPIHAEGRLGAWLVSKDGETITVQEDVTPKTDYDIIFGRDFRLVAQSTSGGNPRTLVPSLRNATLLWSEDGKRYALGREGRVWIGSVADTSRRQLLGPSMERPARNDSSGSDTSAAARAQRARERFTPVRWSPAGNSIAATNSEGIWLVDVASGAKEMIAALPDTTSMEPRPQLVAWSDDGRYVYLAENSRTKWERAITRYDAQTKQKAELVRGVRAFSNLRLSKDGATAVVSATDGNRVPDIWVGDGSLGNLRRVTDANAQLASKPVARTELISYLDADGKTRYGVLHYPTDYVKGTRYPTVFIVYESYFDDSWDAVANLLAAHGYAVVKPSVGFDIGYPGEAWLKGVTAAANAVIQMGVADSARLGVHGTSYGGYATNLLVTQTDRFKAAINMSGKVDVISFYTDSPRLGVRNVHAAEKSQDRIGATLWQQPQKYVQQSAVMFADRIKTPLLLMTGGEDHNVPAINTREMYYALRRLGKPVVWANYTYGGHGTPMTTESDFVDYHQRILDWYAKYLQPKKGANVSDAGGHD